MTGVTRQRERPRVLIAEDHESVARQLRSLLEVECDVIDVVSDGKSLVAVVESLKPEVIVSDISMPGLDPAWPPRASSSKDIRYLWETGARENTGADARGDGDLPVPSVKLQ